MTTKWVRYVAYMRTRKNAGKILVRKPEESGPLASHMHKWKDNIKIDL
jgi:hypothetical protein